MKKPAARPKVAVRQVTAATAQDTVALAALLRDAVEGQASVGFVLPLGADEAEAWARASMQALGPGLMLWLAEVDGRAVGSVQLGPCLKANGRHRGEVMKLLVHRAARGLGVARELMAALERGAREAGLMLLVLDTEAGSPAEAIYRHLGWHHAGNVPDYAVTPTGKLHATAVFYKRVA